MALATPLEIPSGLLFNQRSFDLGFYQQVSPGGAGFVQTISRSEPLWWAEFATPPLNPTRQDQARAFFDALEGSQETFLAFDPSRTMPRAYQSLPITSDPWTMSGFGFAGPRLLSVDYTASTLHIDHLAVGAVMTPGDYISFQMGKIWYLYRVGGLNPTIADSNGQITVVVKPRPNIYGTFVAQTIIRYRQACFQAKILGGVKEENRVDQYPTFSFKCFQMLDRS